MTKYYMTAANNSTLGYWGACKADTLSNAKREATREFGSGYIDDVICVATGDDVSEPRVVVASRSNHPGSKWVDHIV